MRSRNNVKVGVQLIQSNCPAISPSQGPASASDASRRNCAAACILCQYWRSNSDRTGSRARDCSGYTAAADRASRRWRPPSCRQSARAPASTAGAPRIPAATAPLPVPAAAGRASPHRRAPSIDRALRPSSGRLQDREREARAPQPGRAPVAGAVRHDAVGLHGQPTAAVRLAHGERRIGPRTRQPAQRLLQPTIRTHGQGNGQNPGDFGIVRPAAQYRSTGVLPISRLDIVHETKDRPRLWTRKWRVNSK